MKPVPHCYSMAPDADNDVLKATLCGKKVLCVHCSRVIGAVTCPECAKGLGEAGCWPDGVPLPGASKEN